MADAYVQVRPDDSGKKVQTFENAIGGQTVEAQATVVVDTTGVAISVATTAKQDAGNTTLASLDGKLPPQGQARMSASVPVVIASDQLSIYDGYDRRAREALAMAALEQNESISSRYAERHTLMDRHGRTGRGVR